MTYKPREFINAEELGLDLYIAGKQRAAAYATETDPEYGGTVTAPGHDEE